MAATNPPSTTMATTLQSNTDDAATADVTSNFSKLQSPTAAEGSESKQSQPSPTPLLRTSKKKRNNNNNNNNNTSKAAASAWSSSITSASPWDPPAVVSSSSAIPICFSNLVAAAPTPAAADPAAAAAAATAVAAAADPVAWASSITTTAATTAQVAVDSSAAVASFPAVAAAAAESVDKKDSPLFLPSKAKKPWSKLKGPEEMEQQLKNADPMEVFKDYLTSVYAETQKQRKPTEIKKGTTVYEYNKNKKKDLPKLDSTIVETIIPNSAYNFGKAMYIWDEDKEREVKKGMDVLERIKLMKLHNSNDGKATAIQMEQLKHKNETPPDKRFNFGVHDKRELCYLNKIETKDIEVIQNTLLVAFVDQGSGKYTTEWTKKKANTSKNKKKNKKKDTMEVPALQPVANLYWNGQQIKGSDVNLTKVVDTDQLVYVSDQLKVDGPGFHDKLVAFYRVGDYLDVEEIKRAIDVCTEFTHATAVILSICCSHKLCEYYSKKEIQKDNKKFGIPINEKPAKIGKTMTLASRLMIRLKEKLLERSSLFKLEDFLRLCWLTWGLMEADFDKMYPRDEAGERRRLRKSAIQEMKEESVYENATEDEILTDLGLFDNLFIMAITQQATDTSSETIYRSLSYKMKSCKSFLQPLKKMAWCELLELYIEIVRDTSLFVQRASSLLNFLVVVFVLFQGKVPRDPDQLRAFRQMANKKIAIALNTLEDFVALGVDTHVSSFLNACCLSGDLSKADELYIAANISADPGGYLNEIAAEFGQAYADQRDEKRKHLWPIFETILDEVSEEDIEFQKAISKWKRSMKKKLDKSRK